MAGSSLKLNGTIRKFIEDQFMFFVATAAPDGRVNLSPKGLDSLRIINDNKSFGLTCRAAAVRPQHIYWSLHE